MTVAAVSAARHSDGAACSISRAASSVEAALAPILETARVARLDQPAAPRPERVGRARDVAADAAPQREAPSVGIEPEMAFAVGSS